MSRQFKKQRLEECSVFQNPPVTTRKRYSLRELEKLYDTCENPKLLEDLMTAWKGIQEKNPAELNSFFTLAGYHGEPFVGAGAIDSSYWGGYCNHGNVLFPTWHRAYLMKVEEALQSVVHTVSLPYWDETSEETKKHGIPHSLTDEVFVYKTTGKCPIINPLRSYKLQVAIEDASNRAKTYSKPVSYETKRYPLSGLVGTPEAVAESVKQNNKFPKHEEQVHLLNENVKLWINGSDNVAKRDGKAEPENIEMQFKTCLLAPNYTLFSNTTSAHESKPKMKETVVSLEAAHNSVHLAVGGFDYKSFQVPQGGTLEAGIIKNSNGDMGENNTAAFDPIFFFHHCNVDRMFWVWQKKHEFTNNFNIDVKDIGTKSDIPGGQGPVVNFPKDASLTLDTPLTPFMVNKNNGGVRFYSSRDVINIETQLGYTYSIGSLDSEDELPRKKQRKASEKTKHGKKLRVSGINRTLFAGSFIVAAHAKINEKSYMLGFDPVLNRWSVEGCANCQNHLIVHSTFSLEGFTLAEIEKAKFSVKISCRGNEVPPGLEYDFKVVDIE